MLRVSKAVAVSILLNQFKWRILVQRELVKIVIRQVHRLQVPKAQVAKSRFSKI